MERYTGNADYITLEREGVSVQRYVHPNWVRPYERWNRNKVEIMWTPEKFVIKFVRDSASRTRFWLQVEGECSMIFKK